MYNDLEADSPHSQHRTEITEAAKKKGFITMTEDAKRKVLAGMTSPQEALRVLSQPVV